MDVKPLVSMIVLSWNGKECIEQCLWSLQSQTYPNYEIIVVDNNSTDGTHTVVREKFPNVQLILNDQNLGVAKGENVGIKASKGELIAIFNQDVVVHPDWTEALVNEITKSSDVGIIGGITYYYEPNDTIWSAGAKMDLFTGCTWPIDRGKKKISRSIDDIDYIPSCAILLRRDVLERVHLLDEHYFIYLDEVDYCVGAKRMGFSLKIVPSAISWHMVSFSTRKRTSFSYYHKSRGTFHLCFKYFPLKFVFTSMFTQLILFPFYDALILKNPITHLLLRIQAFIWNLCNLEEIITERKYIKSLGRIKCRNRFPEIFRKAIKRATLCKTEQFVNC